MTAAAMIMRTLAATVLLALAATPCRAQSAANAIEIAHQRFAQALSQRDPAMMARLYGEHALVMPPKAEIVEGRAAIQGYWRTVMEAGLRSVALTTIRVDEFGGEVAREIGRFSYEATEPGAPPAEVEGKYVVVWRKSGGEWLHDSDIWNFTDPSEAAQAPGRPVAR